jgi:hypothetical protein
VKNSADLDIGAHEPVLRAANSTGTGREVNVRAGPSPRVGAASARRCRGACFGAVGGLRGIFAISLYLLPKQRPVRRRSHNPDR